MFKYEAGAIEDWKEGKITTGTLLRVFGVSWNGYRAMVDLAKTKGLASVQDLRDEEIHTCLMDVWQTEAGIGI